MPRSVMAHSFAEVPRVEIPRSSFNRSHGHKTTFDADWLIPILVDDVLPGDTFKVDCHFFARLATPLYPIMDNLFLETFFFFIPYRLVWSNWETFHGSQVDPDTSIDLTIPVLHASATTTDLTNGGGIDELADYMGLPYASSVDITEISSLPFRAYNLVWNEWFRSQLLQDSVTVPVDDGPDDGGNDFTLLKRNKRHDYFTSALPSPQRGDAVSLPLGSLAPIMGLGTVADSTPAGSTTVDETGNEGDTYSNQYNSASHTIIIEAAGASAGDLPIVYADLANATAANINDIRLAFQTQRLLERDARSGTRYNEMILAHFGVTVPDYRVQRPEFLGGGSSPINVTPVAQTSGQPTPVANDKLGNLAGFGTVAGTHGFTKSFTEHGILLGLANVRGDITYSQGAERYWWKSTRYDWYYPVLAQIGEQSILNQEIFYQNDANDDLVFGYQERYAEYRYKPSRLSGLFRVDHASTLSAWHLSEDFSALPTLGSSFIQSNTGTPLDRALAINTEPHIIADFFFDMQCARPMPLWGVPGMLDHF